MLELIQYNAVLAMTSTITSDKKLSYSFIEKFYQELGLDSQSPKYL